MNDDLKKDLQNEEILNPSEKPKNKRLNIISLLLIFIIFVGLAFYMIHVDGLDNIINLLKSVDYKWVAGRCNNFNFMVDL